MKLPLIAGLAVALAATPASAETLRIATSADFPPWESVDSDGNMLGFDIDFGNEVCARIEAECEWTNQAYDGLLPALIAGQYDMIVAAISITDERRQSIAFSTAYAQAPAAFAAIGDKFAEVDDQQRNCRRSGRHHIRRRDGPALWRCHRPHLSACRRDHR